jgi:hypothetical protein
VPAPLGAGPAFLLLDRPLFLLRNPIDLSLLSFSSPLGRLRRWGSVAGATPRPGKGVSLCTM